ncbi:MAG TPA: protein-export chaperone SecB [Longimicrobiaceae bacterium]|jgi:preprotein translocase subunit SecB
MNERNEIPTSGFHLLRVITVHQEYTLAPEDDGEQRESANRRMTVNWDWAVSDGREFDVFLGATIEGNEDAPERVNVGLVGEFVLDGNVPSVAFRTFVQMSAPAIMFPYLRQIISDLTGRGPYGAYYLPSVNVVRLMKQYDFESTTGANQLQEEPELAELYGWSTDVQLQLPEAVPLK